MRKILMLIVFSSTIIMGNFAQSSYFDFGGALGISNYSGDLSPPTNSQILGTSLVAGSAFVRYNINSRVSLKAAFSQANITADDAISDKEWQKMRNLSFFTRIYELGVFGELNVFSFNPLETENIFTIYFSAGIAGFHFNPQAELDGQTYYLRDLGTEGQGLDAYPQKDFYSLYEFAVPFGAGLRVKMSENLLFNFEAGWRFTFTDYLDDVSGTYARYNTLLENRSEIAARLSNRTAEYLGQSEPFTEFDDSARGNPDVGDYYFLLHFGVSYFFEAGPNGSSYNKSRRRKSRVSNCPKF